MSAGKFSVDTEMVGVPMVQDSPSSAIIRALSPVNPVCWIEVVLSDPRRLFFWRRPQSIPPSSDHVESVN